MSRRGAFTLALVCALFLVLAYGQRAGLQARQRENCEAINQVKLTLIDYIDEQLDRAAESLPTIAYYKRHPVELGRQLAALQQQRQATHEAFAPTAC